jgi:hypothetical protein
LTGFECNRDVSTIELAHAAEATLKCLTLVFYDLSTSSKNAILPARSALKLNNRGLDNAVQARGIAWAEPPDRSPEEWAKRRKYFRWVWMAFGAFMALGVILMNRCNGR